MSSHQRHSLTLKLTLTAISLALGINAWIITTDSNVTKQPGSSGILCITNCGSEYVSTPHLKKRIPAPKDSQRVS